MLHQSIFSKQSKWKTWQGTKNMSESWFKNSSVQLLKNLIGCKHNMRILCFLLLKTNVFHSLLQNFDRSEVFLFQGLGTSLSLWNPVTSAGSSPALKVTSTWKLPRTKCFDSSVIGLVLGDWSSFCKLCCGMGTTHWGFTTLVTNWDPMPGQTAGWGLVEVDAGDILLNRSFIVWWRVIFIYFSLWEARVPLLRDTFLNSESCGSCFSFSIDLMSNLLST